MELGSFDHFWMNTDATTVYTHIDHVEILGSKLISKVTWYNMRNTHLPAIIVHRYPTGMPNMPKTLTLSNSNSYVGVRNVKHPHSHLQEPSFSQPPNESQSPPESTAQISFRSTNSSQSALERHLCDPA
jgi:hypothetical protein